jgi:hypothetical protein
MSQPNTITIDNCVIWPGAKDKDGYGFVKIQGVQKRAHRVALEKKLGRGIAAGLQALHTCHNPSCVNPEHLEEGSNKDNQHQRRAREGSLAKQVLGVHAY